MNTGQRMIKIFATVFAVILSVTIIGGIVSALFFGFGIGNWNKGNRINETQNNGNRITNTNTYNFSESYTGIDSIEIFSAANIIIICSGDEFRVDMENVRTECTARADGNVFIIDDAKNLNSNIFDLLDDFSGNNNIMKNSKITITVPDNVTLKDVNIEAGAGTLKLRDFTAESLRISSGAGTIKADRVTANGVQLGTGAGTIDFRNVIFNNTRMEAGAGEFLVSGRLLGYTDIQCGVGSLELNLEDPQSAYNLQVEKGLGNITVNGSSHFSVSSQNGADNSLMVRGGVGNVKISFAEE